MTIAVCVACGARKCGAFVPCGHCGYEPQTVMDKAKSIMLSDHHFPLEELLKFQSTIEAGGQPPYDSVSLALLARPILEEAYFWETFDDARGILPCKECGKVFAPELEEVYCGDCSSEIEEPLSPCAKCLLLYDRGARYCQKCGAPLTPDSNLSTKSIGTNMALFVRRALRSGKPFAETQHLKEFRCRLSDEERPVSEFELEILGMYIGMLTLRKHLPSGQLLVKCVREMVGLYRESFMLDGADTQTANAGAHLCMKRFDQYDQALAVQPERWILFLANEATKNCFHVERDLGAAVEMVAVIGYLAKVFDECIQGVTFQRST